MADERTTSGSQVESGVGTAGNREAQKVDAGKGGDTLAPGTPAPQPGGPEPRTSTPAEGASKKS